MSVEKTVGGYYGSPLNEFLSVNLPHNISIMNLDCVIHKYSDKYGRLRLRHIESKHHGEKMGDAQVRFLDEQAKRFGPLTDDKFIYDEFAVYGDEPDFNDCTIINWLTKQEIHSVSAKQLLRFSSFDIEFNELYLE